MPMSAKVSIIIPIYNVEKYIEEAIQSVLAQKMSAFELILINDGSTDQSGERSRQFLADERVTYLEQSNQGVAAARNRGLQAAQGEFVFFMDADDTIDPCFLGNAYRAAQQQHHDVVVLGAAYASRLPHPTALPTCAQFWRTAFLREHPEIRFPPGIQPGEDGLFSHQLLALTTKIGFCPDADYYYRQHSDQNHRRILGQSENVLAQIPDWLSILAAFYDRMHLWEAKALHAARFMQHEPFELRYLAMPLSDAQKDLLFKMIRQFFQQRLAPFLSPVERATLSPAFQKFLTCPRHTDFDTWLIQEIERVRRGYRRSLLLSKLIPWSPWRRARRAQINRQFDLRMHSLDPGRTM